MFNTLIMVYILHYEMVNLPQYNISNPLYALYNKTMKSTFYSTSGTKSNYSELCLFVCLILLYVLKCWIRQFSWGGGWLGDYRLGQRIDDALHALRQPSYLSLPTTDPLCPNPGALTQLQPRLWCLGRFHLCLDASNQRSIDIYLWH